MIKKERRTQRHACTGCNGKGSASSPGESCANCGGLGYIEPPSGLETVCPLCNGDGSIKASRMCNECKGKGFTVSIYELTDDINTCLPCRGSGWISEEVRYSDLYGERVERRQVKCLRCGGNGFNVSYTYKTIR